MKRPMRDPWRFSPVKLRRLYSAEGRSAYEIAPRMGCSAGTVYRILSSLGIPIRPRGTFTMTGAPVTIGIDELRRRYLEEGHFAAGSMKPKIEAAVEFLGGAGGGAGKAALITDPAHLVDAFEGRTGTWIVP